MTRLYLVIIYIILTFIGYYLPSVIFSDGKIVVFTLIAVYLLKELDWFLIKKSCKNSKDKICQFIKTKIGSKGKLVKNDKLIEIKELDIKE